MKVTTVGVDLAKNVFQPHCVNEFCKVVIKMLLRPDQMAEFLVGIPDDRDRSFRRIVTDLGG